MQNTTKFQICRDYESVVVVIINRKGPETTRSSREMGLSFATTLWGLVFDVVVARLMDDDFHFDHLYGAVAPEPTGRGV